MHVLETDEGWCTANAVEGHVLLTAGHCYQNQDDIKIDGQHVHVLKAIFDGNDHVLLFEDTIWFKNRIPLKYVAPVQGEQVHYYGNPMAIDNMVDQRREGYVSGQHDVDNALAIIMVVPSIPGDSGSAILNERGELVGVVLGHDDVFCYSYPLVFTDAELREARNFK